MKDSLEGLISKVMPDENRITEMGGELKTLQQKKLEQRLEINEQKRGTILKISEEMIVDLGEKYQEEQYKNQQGPREPGRRNPSEKSNSQKQHC